VALQLLDLIVQGFVTQVQNLFSSGDEKAFCHGWSERGLENAGLNAIDVFENICTDIQALLGALNLLYDALPFIVIAARRAGSWQGRIQFLIDDFQAVFQVRYGRFDHFVILGDQLRSDLG
jgi:hypothetical protein